MVVCELSLLFLFSAVHEHLGWMMRLNCRLSLALVSPQQILLFGVQLLDPHQISSN